MGKIIKTAALILFVLAILLLALSACDINNELHPLVVNGPVIEKKYFPGEAPSMIYVPPSIISTAGEPERWQVVILSTNERSSISTKYRLSVSKTFYESIHIGDTLTIIRESRAEGWRIQKVQKTINDQ